MRTIVVAKFNEDVSWLLQLNGWACEIWDKGRDVHEPYNWKLRNVGREAHTYLHWIVGALKGPRKLPEEVVFCQGNPFDHDRDFIAHLNDPAFAFFGAVSGCPSSGEPHMGDAILDDYCRVLGLPVQPEYKFVAGAQYRLTAKQIRSRPLAFYECLLALTKLENKAPWSLERLWPAIWGIDLA
jgi:hypothetical protein